MARLAAATVMGGLVWAGVAAVTGEAEVSGGRCCEVRP